MNYITLLNEFWQLRQIKPISSSEADVYFALLNVANKLRWPKSFALPLQNISLVTGLSVKTVKRARLALVELGLIDFSGDKNYRGCSQIYTLKGGQERGAKLPPLIEKGGQERESKLPPLAKEEIPPIPPKEENIYTGYKQENYLASLDTRVTHAHNSLALIPSQEINSIQKLRNDFFGRLGREQLMMAMRFPSVEVYKMLCEEILAEWEIAKGTDFPVTSDVKNHFINLLRIKKRIWEEQGGRTRTQARTELMSSAFNQLNNAIANETAQQQYEETDIGF